MAQTRRKTEYRESYYRSAGRYYEDGSAARQYQEEAVPVRKKRRQEEVRPRKRKNQKRKTYEKAAIIAARSVSFDLGYTVLITIALVATFISLAWMVSMQGKIEGQQEHVASLQSQLMEKQADNAAYEDELNNMYSLDDIYKIAVSELGMVYSQKGQIIYYESANEDYVNQFEDVPEAR